MTDPLSSDQSSIPGFQFRAALRFREGLNALLQEGFDGLETLSADEVLQVAEEVLIFLWTFFRDERLLVNKDNPTIFAGDVNTNPDYACDTETPLGRPLSIRGWAIKPRRKRDQEFAALCYDLILVFHGYREGVIKTPSEIRVLLQKKLEQRLGKKLKAVMTSVAKNYSTGVPGYTEEDTELPPIEWGPVTKEMAKKVPGLSQNAKQAIRNYNAAGSRIQRRHNKSP